MRDYLEELLEGSGALLEELRRAERGLSALSGGERNRETGAEREELGVVSPEAERVDGGKRLVNLLEDVVDAEKRTEKAPEEGRIGGTEPSEGPAEDLGRSGVVPAAVGTAERGLPLAVQLERLDRAAASGGGPAEGGSGGRQALVPLLPGRRTAGARLSGAEVPGGDWSGAGGELPSSGGTDWVEQADRAFRRDSRRYDGGFYLY